MEKEKYQQLSPEGVKKFEEENITEEQRGKSEEREATFEVKLDVGSEEVEKLKQQELQGASNEKDRIKMLTSMSGKEICEFWVSEIKNMQLSKGEIIMIKRGSWYSYLDKSDVVHKTIQDVVDDPFEFIRVTGDSIIVREAAFHKSYKGYQEDEGGGLYAGEREIPFRRIIGIYKDLEQILPS